MTESTMFIRLGVAAPYRYFHKPSLNDLINHEAVCRTAPAKAVLLNRLFLDPFKRFGVLRRNHLESG